MLRFAAVLAAILDGLRRAASAPAILAGTLALTFLLALQPDAGGNWHFPALARFLAFGAAVRWSQGSGLMFVVVWSFLAGGILDRYARNRPTRGRGFFGACGAHLPAMLRLGAAEWLIWRALSVLDPGAARDSITLIAGFAAGLLLLYARVRLVVEDRRSALGALLAGGRFIRRNPAAVALCLIFSAALWTVIRLWGHFGRGRGFAGGGWLDIATAELLTGLMLFVVFSSWASAIVLFQARLAHASYTAGPPLEWPESPAAEAIANLAPSSRLP